MSNSGRRESVEPPDWASPPTRYGWGFREMNIFNGNHLLPFGFAKDSVEGEKKGKSRRPHWSREGSSGVFPLSGWAE